DDEGLAVLDLVAGRGTYFDDDSGHRGGDRAPARGLAFGDRVCRALALVLDGDGQAFAARLHDDAAVGRLDEQVVALAVDQQRERGSVAGRRQVEGPGALAGTRHQSAVTRLEGELELAAEHAGEVLHRAPPPSRSNLPASFHADAVRPEHGVPWPFCRTSAKRAAAAASAAISMVSSDGVRSMLSRMLVSYSPDTKRGSPSTRSATGIEVVTPTRRSSSSARRQRAIACARSSPCTISLPTMLS